jgi:hypothetical protein
VRVQGAGRLLIVLQALNTAVRFTLIAPRIPPRPYLSGAAFSSNSLRDTAMRISRWTALPAALLLGACATAEPRPATAGATAADRAHLDAMSHEHAGETPTA